jgi:FtsX-like permease family protein
LSLSRSPTVDDEPRITAGVSAITLSLAAQSEVLQYDSTLPDLLARVDGQAAGARVLIAVTVAQGLLVSFFALGIVLQRIGRARAAEWGVGRLRGVPRGRWITAVYLEPAVALLLGLPTGLLAGAVLARLVAAVELRPGTPVDVWRWPVLVAAGGTAVAALVALVAASLRSLRRPLVDLIQQGSESRRLGVVGAVAQSAVLILAGATAYQLVAGGVLGASGGQLGLLAPALFALALAVLVVRGAVLVVARLTARPARTLTGLVVGRQAARTPSSLNPAIVIAVGLALAVFATQVLVLSVRNQGLRADATVGAATVAQVDVPRGTDLVAAVRAADPSGRYAMAAQERAGSADGGTSRIVAVDGSRLAAVAAWSPQWSGVTGDLAQALHPATTTPVVLRGTRVTVRLDGIRMKVRRGINPGTGNLSDIPESELAPPELALVVLSRGSWQSVPLGTRARRGAGWWACGSCRGRARRTPGGSRSPQWPPTGNRRAPRCGGCVPPAAGRSGSGSATRRARRRSRPRRPIRAAWRSRSPTRSAPTRPWCRRRTPPTRCRRSSDR